MNTLTWLGRVALPLAMLALLLIFRADFFGTRESQEESVESGNLAAEESVRSGSAGVATADSRVRTLVGDTVQSERNPASGQATSPNGERAPSKSGPASPRGITRLGGSGAYARIGTVTRRTLGVSAASEPLSAEVADLPSSTIHFAAAVAVAAKPGKPTVGPTCTVHLAREGGSPEQLAKFTLRADQSSWTEAKVELESLSRGRLLLGCQQDVEAPIAVVWAQPFAIHSVATRRAPLVVLVSLDTLRADHVSGFGAPIGLTPELRKLGNEGLRMLAATSEGTMTLHSHFGMLYSRFYGYALRRQRVETLADVLTGAGFTTAGFTGGGFVGSNFNFHRGFDLYSEYQGAAHGLTENAAFPHILSESLEWIDLHAGIPSFVFIHTYALHQQPAEEQKWREVHGSWAKFARTPEQLDEDRTFYRNLARETDATLAPLFDKLRSLSETRDVLLIVTSDHGEAFGEHDNSRHGYARDISPHDEIIHIPLIIWGPRLVPTGRTSTMPAMLMDIPPSILAALDIAAAPSMLGTDLWPLWSRASSGQAAEGFAANSVGSVSDAHSFWSLRSSSKKLIAPKDICAECEYELYDLDADPGELHNLAKERPAVVAEMLAQLRRRLVDFEVTNDVDDGPLPNCQRCGWVRFGDFWQALAVTDEEAPEPPDEIDPAVRERLRALGYVE